MLDWIGNMPRHLSRQRTWRYLRIPVRELKTGDLLFLKNKRSPRLVTHVAMALGPEKVFHCSTKGASIEKINDLFMIYVQPADVGAMLSYVDPRTNGEILYHSQKI